MADHQNGFERSRLICIKNCSLTGAVKPILKAAVKTTHADVTCLGQTAGIPKTKLQLSFPEFCNIKHLTF